MATLAVSTIKAVTFVAGSILIANGLTSSSAVRSASRDVLALRAARDEVQEAVNTALRSRKKKARLLFHYGRKDKIDLIMATGIIPVGEASGPFPRGAFATDLAGWLAESVLTRSELVRRIFGSVNAARYAQTAWFVAFVEQKPNTFAKIAPSIYFSQKRAKVIPLVRSTNLLGEL